ncbi:MAG TPA: NAD(+) diphosphatase [Syntrophorhabdales bacterium]|nr:NAD(+) diphosphatase [Syntrophorhabdales bacterium]
MSGKFTPGVSPSPRQGGPARWFFFSGHKLLVSVENSKPDIPVLQDGPQDLGLETVRLHFLGSLDGQPCYAAEVAEGIDPPAGMLFNGLRNLFDSLDDALYRLAVVAVQVVDWDRLHQFCGRCGEKTVYKEGVRAKECRRCGLISFPRLSPAVIVAVERGRKLLLARANRFPTHFYSVLAGFVEPGETLEEAVAREVKEEVGIEVRDIRYFGSQPWPFPDSLMIGFTAQYAGGEISIDEAEIVEAGWFEADSLPSLPGKISIARQLIDWFVEKQRRG